MTTNASSINLNGIDQALRYLQHEFLGLENDEDRWKHQNDTLRQQVMQLQSERQQQESVHHDLIRHIKMLEYALQYERMDQLQTLEEALDKRSPAIVHRLSSTGKVREAVERLNLSSPRPSQSDLPCPATPKTPTASNPANPKTPTASDPAPATHKTPTAGFFPEKESAISLPDPVTDKPPVSLTNVSSCTVSTEKSIVSSSVSTAKSSLAVSSSAHRPLKLRHKLVGHLDAIRCLCLHPDGDYVISGSEDMTVKIWDLKQPLTKPSGLSKAKRVRQDLVPSITLRPHEDIVTSVTVLSSEWTSSSSSILLSCGKDQSIHQRLFPTSTKSNIPQSKSTEIYVTHNAHEDCIWDLSPLPYSNRLYSSGADATVKLWTVTSDAPILLNAALSISSAATITRSVLTNASTCVIGTFESGIEHWDIEKQEKLRTLLSLEPQASCSSMSSSIQSLVCHPTMPLILAGLASGEIQVQDLRQHRLVRSFSGHPQVPVTDLALDASGLYCYSSGHDGSFRVWSLQRQSSSSTSSSSLNKDTRASSSSSCVQEQSCHRLKYRESVHALAYSSKGRFLLTAGADGNIKLFQ